MPKMKTNSGSKKRFALTGTKRNLTHFGLVHKADESRVKALLGI